MHENGMMRVTAVCLGVLLALLSARSLATDQPIAEKPEFRDGDVFEYVDRFQSIACKRWEIKGHASDGSLLSQCEDNIAYFSPDTGAFERIVKRDGTELVKFQPYAPAIPFPLSVGTKWGGAFKVSAVTELASPYLEQKCEVTAYETIKIAAGELPAFRLDCATRWSVWPLHGNVTATMWYAPSAKAVVKSVNGSGSKWDMELASYTLK